MAEKFVVFVVLKPESLIDLHELAKRLKIEAVKNSQCHQFEYDIHDYVRCIRFDELWEDDHSYAPEHQALIDQMLKESAVYDKVIQPS